MLNMFICMFFSQTPNHYAIETIGHCIRSSFRGPYWCRKIQERSYH